MGAQLKARELCVLPNPPDDLAEFLELSITVNIHGEIDNYLTEDVLRMLHTRSLPRRVTINISSIGGDVLKARDIARSIRELHEGGREVRIITSSACFSMALIVLLSLPIEYRYSSTRTKFMIHSTFFRDQWGKRATDLSTQDRAESHLTNEVYLIQPLLKGTYIEEGSLRQLVASKRDEYFSPEEALRLGFVSAIY